MPGESQRNGPGLRFFIKEPQFVRLDDVKCPGSVLPLPVLHSVFRESQYIGHTYVPPQRVRRPYVVFPPESRVTAASVRICRTSFPFFCRGWLQAAKPKGCAVNGQKKIPTARKNCRDPFRSSDSVSPIDQALYPSGSSGLSPL